MSIKFNDTQLVLLRAASQRDDHCLVPPTGPKRSQAQRTVAKLLEAGLVKETRAKAGAPIWRRDEETGQTYALKLTAAGAKAIAVDDATASIELLQRSDDAALAKLVAATGWLSHTTRAALTGLRKRGYAVGIDRADTGRGSVYRIDPTEMGDDSVAPQVEAAPTCEAPPDRPERAASLRTRRAA